LKYSDFQQVMSIPRMTRYMASVGNNTKHAMTLYRKNLRLSQELFTVIGCYEIALSKGIDRNANSSSQNSNWTISAKFAL
jgi:hypothetical protein